MVDYVSLLKAFGIQATVILGIYVTLLLLLRFSKFYRLARCPECNSLLKRKKRNSIDKWVPIFTLGILPVRRYRCYACYWEGQAFLIPTEPKKGQDVALDEDEED
jgi:uncharacterized protein with PIN domain